MRSVPAVSGVSARRLHFVVGMPRGGTTFVLRRLHQHPDVLAFGESRFFGNDWVAPDDDGWWDDERLAKVRAQLLANPLDSNLPRPHDPRDRPGWIDHIDSDEADRRLEQMFDEIEAPVRPGEVYAGLCDALAEGSGASVVIEKTPHHLRHVDRLLRHVPDARVLVILRDPYDFLLSYKHARDRRADAARRQAEAVMWQPTGVALLWRSYWRAARDASQRFGAQVQIVRLEDIRDAPEREMAEVLDFLGLAAHDVLAGAPARDNSSFRGERPELSAGEIAAFNLVAAGDATEAGYEVRSSGLGRVRAVVASAGVIPWAMKNVAEARRRTDGGLLRYARDAVLRRR